MGASIDRRELVGNFTGLQGLCVACNALGSFDFGAAGSGFHPVMLMGTDWRGLTSGSSKARAWIRVGCVTIARLVSGCRGRHASGTTVRLATVLGIGKILFCNGLRDQEADEVPTMSCNELGGVAFVLQLA